MEADFTGCIARNFEPVGGGVRRITDRVVAIAAGKAVGIVAALADQHIVAQPALQQVVGAIAGQYIIGKTGCARQQVGGGPDRAVGKADFFHLARTQGVLNGNPRPSGADDQCKVFAISALPHLDTGGGDARCQDQRVGATAVGDPVMPAGGAEGIAIVAITAFKPIIARAAIKAVCAAIAEDQIVAGPAGQHIVEGIAADHIAAAAGGARQGQQGGFGPHRAIGKFDAAHAHARRRRTAQIDPVPGADHFQHDIGRPGNHAHIGGGDSGGKAQRVGAAGIGNHILPIAPREQVSIIAQPALQQVITGAAGENIVAACTDQRVVAAPARQTG